MKDVYRGEVISTVKGGEAIVSVLNVSECENEINESHINKILYTEENDYDALS